MKRRNWVLLMGGVVAVVVLAGASYVAVSLLTTGSPGPLAWIGLGAASSNQRRDYELIPATELPPTQADVAGLVTVVQNRTLTIMAKAPAGVSAPPSQVVITASTLVYRDTTRDGGVNIVDGKVQQHVETFDATLIKAGDGLVAWDNPRGDQLTATVVMVVVPPATQTP